MPHKRSPQGAAKRQAARNLHASLMENCFGTEAGRRVTTVWADKGNGLVPVAIVDEELLKPERVHGGIMKFDVEISRKGDVKIVGRMADEDALTTKTVNKRAARLSNDHHRRRNW